MGYKRSASAEEKTKKPLRLLILGGTGFTGPFQVRYALERGHKVTVFNRGKTHPGETPKEVEQLIGDRNGQLDALKNRKWDVVIDNPTSAPVWVRDAAQILKGNVDRYVFISTISVYADTSKPGTDETAPLAKYNGPDAMKESRESIIASKFQLYGPLKALSEQEAEKWFPKQTLIVRPGLIVGPRDETDRFSYWPVRIDRGGEVLAPGDPSDPVQFIDGRDLAEWVIRMVETTRDRHLQRDRTGQDARGRRDARRNQDREQIEGELHLGEHRFSRSAESGALVGHAGVGSAARRRSRDGAHQHPARIGERSHVPPAG